MGSGERTPFPHSPLPIPHSPSSTPEGQDQFHQNQNHYDQFERLALRCVDAVVQHLVKVGDDFELSRDDSVPLVQVEPASRRRMQPRQVEVADQFQSVFDPLVHQRRLDSQLGQVLNGLFVGRPERDRPFDPFSHERAVLVDLTVQLLIDVASFQQLDVDQFQDAGRILVIAVIDDRRVPVQQRQIVFVILNGLGQSIVLLSEAQIGGFKPQRPRQQPAMPGQQFLGAHRAIQLLDDEQVVILDHVGQPRAKDGWLYLSHQRFGLLFSVAPEVEVVEIVADLRQIFERQFNPLPYRPSISDADRAEIEDRGLNASRDGEMARGQPQAQNLRWFCVLHVRRRLLLARERLDRRRRQHRAQPFKRHLIPDVESEQSDHLTLNNPRHIISRPNNGSPGIVTNPYFYSHPDYLCYTPRRLWLAQQ